MFVRPVRLVRCGPLASCLLTVLLVVPDARAQRLEKPVQEWWKLHRLLMVPEEVKALQQVKAADLDEFTRIFWARRAPSTPAPTNAYRAAVDKARVEADARFGDVGKRGSATGCGQALLLLGHPDEIAGDELRTTFNSRPSSEGANSRIGARDGARRAELWTYKSTATRTFLMPGGDLKLQFDDGCEFAESPRTMDELARLAAVRITHPEIGYEFTGDGRLKPLAVSAASSPARALLDQPRSDFSVSFEVKIQVPGQGGAYTAGILRGAAGALQSSPSGSPVALRAMGRATPASGASTDAEEKPVFALVRPDGSFISSYGLTLSPGRQRVAVAVLEPVSGKAGVAVAEIDAPDYAAKTLVVSPLAVLCGDSPSEAGAPPANDPLAAFAIGSQRLAARPGNALANSESLQLLVLVHNAALDPATGRASVKASFSVLQDGKVIAKGKDQTFETPGAAPSVGPIALAPFAPGRYLARVEIADEIARTTVVRETPFEVTASPGR